ncbi:CoA transferase [Planotetraspora sp. GP83]|uniref:CoA transferase n=1 Tax=Planotetraspora sp. GP83 TaxID=3156264 RepID=UPI00351330C5
MAGVGGWLREHAGSELIERATLLGVAAVPVRFPAGTPALPRPLVPRPLKGLLVVDFSALWAGPLCAHLLGLAGARIVKSRLPSGRTGRGAATPPSTFILPSRCTVMPMSGRLR